MVFSRQWFGRKAKLFSSGSLPKALLMLMLGGGLLFVNACQKGRSPEPQAKPNQENRLIVNDAILEQSDLKGKLLWKLQAKEAIYSQDRKTATLKELVGNFYQDGKVILSLKAQGGRVINDGERILLEGNILVTDNRYGAVFEAKKAEWQPQKFLLDITDSLMVKYPNGKLSAKKGKYFIDRQELELTDTVEAIAVKPTIRLRSKKLLWQLKKDKISGEQGLTIERYTKEKITARLQAEKGEALLKEEKIMVSGNVLLNSLEPAVQFTSGQAVWDLKSGLITGKDSIQLTNNKEKVQFQASQGQFNLNTQQANLTGAVKGTNEQPPATLNANQVDWNLETELLTAQGNVVYQQNNPRLKLNGDRAVGKLSQDQLVISGTKGKQVTTVVIP